jgi:uncharacterized membrane-anchored protein YhcB (DUF1043 family)
MKRRAELWRELLEVQREEVAHLTQSAETYRELAADYERRLAEARRALAEIERKLHE